MVAGEADCIPNDPGERTAALGESSALSKGTDIGSFKSCFDDENKLTPAQAAQNEVADSREELDPSRAPSLLEG